MVFVEGQGCMYIGRDVGEINVILVLVKAE
jgi:hypothetical protein